MISRLSRRDRELLAKRREGKLSKEENWELTQRSFSNADLFDALAIESIVEAGLSNPVAFRDPARAAAAEMAPRAGFPFVRWGLILASGCAAVLIFLIYFRSTGTRSQQALAPQALPAVPAKSPHPALKPVLGLAGSQDQPVLLAARLVAVKHEDIGFRGEDDSNRLPRRTGPVLSINGETAMVGLGSVDGIKEGSRLRIVREGEETSVVEASVVFWERSRIRTVSGSPIQMNDQMEVPARNHLTALWDRVLFFSADQKHSEACRLADEALQYAGTAKVDARLKVLARQHAAEAYFKAGDSARAKRLLSQVVLDGRGTLTKRELSDALEALGVLSLLDGNLEEARSVLNEAGQLTSTDTRTESHARALNNLGVLEELAGNFPQALQFFESARAEMVSQKSKSAAECMRTIEANLARRRSAK